MKTNDKNDLRSISKKELENKILEKNKELMRTEVQLRLGQNTRHLPPTKQRFTNVSKIKKEIAIMQTVLNGIG